MDDIKTFEESLLNEEELKAYKEKLAKEEQDALYYKKAFENPEEYFEMLKDNYTKYLDDAFDAMEDDFFSEEELNEMGDIEVAEFDFSEEECEIETFSEPEYSPEFLQMYEKYLNKEIGLDAFAGSELVMLWAKLDDDLKQNKQAYETALKEYKELKGE